MTTILFNHCITVTQENVKNHTMYLSRVPVFPSTPFHLLYFHSASAVSLRLSSATTDTGLA